MAHPTFTTSCSISIMRCDFATMIRWISWERLPGYARRELHARYVILSELYNNRANERVLVKYDVSDFAHAPAQSSHDSYFTGLANQ
jgi:hypothetical protein